MSLVYRLVGDNRPIAFQVTPAATSTPTVRLYIDQAGTTPAGGVAATVSGQDNAWSYAVPGVLGPGTYYPKITAQTAAGTATGGLEVLVLTTATISVPGSAYASATDLATYLGTEAPEDADRLLVRASEVIDQALTAACYRTTSAGTPADTEVIDALRQATCAQVELWLAGDEEEDVLGPTQGVALGGLQLQYGAGDNRITPTYLAPRAWRVLQACAWIVW